MTHIEQRYDTATNWLAVDPVLHIGEAGHESDTGRWKLGDGENPWSALPYKSGVDSVAGRTGEVELVVADVEGAAPLASPELTGTPKAPTRATSDSSTNIATTAFVKAVRDALVDDAPLGLNTLREIAEAIDEDPGFAGNVFVALGLKAPINSPVFTGAPKAPTPVPEGDDTNIATTGYVYDSLQDFAGGAWTQYGDTATLLTSTGTNPTLGSGGVAQGYYKRIGNTVHYRIRVSVGSGQTTGTGAYRFLLPVPARMGVGQDQNMGIANVGNVGGTQGLFIPLLPTSTQLSLMSVGGITVSATAFDTSGSAQNYNIHGTYEAE